MSSFIDHLVGAGDDAGRSPDHGARGYVAAPVRGVRLLKPKLVSEWERGETRPSGPSLKPLSIVKARGLDAIA